MAYENMYFSYENVFNKQNNSMYFIDNNVIHSTIVIKKEHLAFIFMDIIMVAIKMFHHCFKIYKKCVKMIAGLCEKLYDNLEYSEAKTIVGLSIVVCFISVLTLHLFFCLTKKHNQILQLERKLKIVNEKEKC